MPARKYEIKTAGPVRAKASPGKMNIPELIIAPVAMLKTSKNPNLFFNSIYISLFLTESKKYTEIKFLTLGLIF
jgi:hypothetical protein